MENFDMITVLPFLRQLGISPDSLGPDKLTQLYEVTKSIKDMSDITPEISKKIIDIFGISTKGIQKPIKNTVKIGRNELCPCGKGKKYKKCCLK